MIIRRLKFSTVGVATGLFCLTILYSIEMSGLGSHPYLYAWSIVCVDDLFRNFVDGIWSLCVH